MTATTPEIRTVAGLIAGLEERCRLAERTRDGAQAAASAAVERRREAEQQRDILLNAIEEACRDDDCAMGGNTIEVLTGAYESVVKAAGLRRWPEVA